LFFEYLAFRKQPLLLPNDIKGKSRKYLAGRMLPIALIALPEYIAHRRTIRAVQKVKGKPLPFREGYTKPAQLLTKHAGIPDINTGLCPIRNIQHQ